MCIIFVRSISKDCSAIYILVFSLLETTNKARWLHITREYDNNEKE